MQSKLTSTGLSSETIKKINLIFENYPKIDKVCLYGSRAKGNYRDGSDIDLSIFGKAMRASELLAIENKLDDLLLSYKIDLSLFHQIKNVDLLEHIRRVGLVFYRKEKFTAE